MEFGPSHDQRQLERLIELIRARDLQVIAASSDPAKAVALDDDLEDLVERVLRTLID